MNQNNEKLIKSILEKFPFLSYGVFYETPYLGIIQNCDSQLLSMYVLDSIPEETLRREFLDLGMNWWWESNRQIPISIFLAREIFIYRYAIRNFATKDIKVILGPITSLNDIIIKRVKRKSITLVRRVP